MTRAVEQSSAERLAGEGLDTGLRWTDSHCHMGRSDAEEIASDALAAGVDRLVIVGTDLESSIESISTSRLLSKHSGAGGQGEGNALRAHAAVGIHPHHAVDGVAGLSDLLADDRVVAVGECGLDYYYEHSPREAQLEVFAAQIEMAKSSGLTLVIHTRDAWEETFGVLDAVGVPERTILHCFSGGPEQARAALDRGAYLSFSGIVSFPSAVDVREAAALCPSDRILVETDSPYLAPVPFRGKTNRPGLVPLVGRALSEVRGVGHSEIAERTTANALRAFALT